MTVFGSTCTRPLIDRTLICNAILYHFQITLICGRINRPSSHSHFFSSRAHLSNSSLFVSATSSRNMFRLPVNSATTIYAPTQTPKSISTTSLHFKPLFQITRARRSLNQLSRLRIHLVQEFHIRRIQSRKNMFETNIVVIHDQIPQISLPIRPFLRSRPHPKSIYAVAAEEDMLLLCRFVL